MSSEIDPSRAQKAEQLLSDLEASKAGAVAAIEAFRVSFVAAGSFLDDNHVFEELDEGIEVEDDLHALKQAWTALPNPADLLEDF